MNFETQTVWLNYPFIIWGRYNCDAQEQTDQVAYLMRLSEIIAHESMLYILKCRTNECINYNTWRSKPQVGKWQPREI